MSLGSDKNWNTKEFFETQFRIIWSHQVSAEVVEQLNLNADLDFLGIALLLLWVTERVISLLEDGFSEYEELWVHVVEKARRRLGMERER